MKTIIRWILILAGTAVVLSVALSAALLILVDPNDYRSEIEAAVKEQTGRTLTLDGELSLKTFPCCGLDLGGLSLSNPPGFKEEIFATVQSAGVSLQLWPLISRQELQVGQVTLNGLNLNLISRKDGSVNWEFSGEDTAASTEQSSDVGLTNLNIAGVTITAGMLVYVDEAIDERIELGRLNLETGAIKHMEPFPLSTSFEASGLMPDTLVTLSMNATGRADLKDMLLNLGDATLDVNMRGADLPGGVVDVVAELGFVQNLGGLKSDIGGLDAKVSTAGVNLRLTGAGALNDNNPDLSGKLTIEDFAPRKLMQTLGSDPIISADPSVLGEFALNSDWSYDGSGDNAGLTNIKATLDDSVITGAAKIVNMTDSRYSFDLTFDELDADRYMEPASEAEEGAPTSDDEAAMNEALGLPIKDLRELKLRGLLKFGKLKVSDARLTDFKTSVVAQDGIIRLNPTTAKLYGGQYTGDVTLNVKGFQPRLQIDQQLAGVQMQPLLTDTADFKGLAGKTDLKIKGKANGNSMGRLIKNLKGDLSVNMTEGVYKGVDIWYEIRKARATINKTQAPPKPSDPQTAIEKFTATGLFEGGLLQNKELLLTAPNLIVTGVGDVNLLKSTLDYKLKAEVVGTPTFDGETLTKLAGLKLPITVKGPISAPDKIGVDSSALAGMLKDNVKQDVKNKLKDKFGLNEKSADSTATAAPADGAPAPAEKPVDRKEELKKKALRGLLGD